MSIGRVWRILWGTNQENVLDFAWPTVGDEPTFRRQPREGSEKVKINSVQESWITGRDFYGALKARWFGMTQWAGATGLQAFFDNAGDSNTFTLVPDAVNAPNFKIPGCFLSDPFDAPSPTLEPDGSQSIPLEFWNPSYDLGLAFRGLMFDYEPGGDLTPATVARGSVANYFTNQFLVGQSVAGVIRDRHYTLGTAGSRTSLIEASKINRILQSEALATSPWASIGSQAITVTNNNAIAPNGLNTAATLVPSTVSGTHGIGQSLTITSGEAVAASIFVKAGGYPAFLFRFGDTGSTNGFHVTFDASTGLFGTVHTGFGTGTLTGFTAIPLNNGWYRLLIWGTVAGGVTTSQLFLYAFDTIAHANAGTAYAGNGTSGVQAWGAMVERNGIANGVFPNAAAPVPPTSYLATVASTATRSADLVQYPFNFAPQALFFYVKFIELGTLAQTGLLVGTGSGSNAGLFWTTNASPLSYEFFHFRPGVPNVGSIFASGPTPNYGDTVELLGILNADGSTSCRMSINGAADVVGNTVTDSHQALAFAWDSPILDFGATTGINGFQQIKVGPLVQSPGITINTMALARTA